MELGLNREKITYLRLFYKYNEPVFLLQVDLMQF